MKKLPKSRREFLTKIFSTEDKSNQDLTPTTPDDSGQNDKIKMLTSEGKIVEVDSQVANKSQTTSRTSNKELLKWMIGGKKK